VLPRALSSPELLAQDPDDSDAVDGYSFDEETSVLGEPSTVGKALDPSPLGIADEVDDYADPSGAPTVLGRRPPGLRAPKPVAPDPSLAQREPETVPHRKIDRAALPPRRLPPQEATGTTLRCAPIPPPPALVDPRVALVALPDPAPPAPSNTLPDGLSQPVMTAELPKLPQNNLPQWPTSPHVDPAAPPAIRTPVVMIAESEDSLTRFSPVTSTSTRRFVPNAPNPPKARGTVVLPRVALPRLMAGAVPRFQRAAAFVAGGLFVSVVVVVVLGARARGSATATTGPEPASTLIPVDVSPPSMAALATPAPKPSVTGTVIAASVPASAATVVAPAPIAPPPAAAGANLAAPAPSTEAPRKKGAQRPAPRPTGSVRKEPVPL
jgi:hypothetical protein